MVSFSCEVCNDTVVKKKLDQHRSRCPDAYFTCIDCSTTFNGTEYRSHTQCISEAEKYEKSLYKGKKTNPKPVQKQQAEAPKAKPEPKPVVEKKSKADKKAKSDKKKADALDLTKYGSGSLYKIVKAISSDTKKDKKDVLKKLQVRVENGKIFLDV